MKKEPVDAIKAMESMMTPESIERSDAIFRKEMAKSSGKTYVALDNVSYFLRSSGAPSANIQDAEVFTHRRDAYAHCLKHGFEPRAKDSNGEHWRPHAELMCPKCLDLDRGLEECDLCHGDYLGYLGTIHTTEAGR